MITPRTTRLVRVQGLRGLQRTLIDALPSDPRLARGCAVILPSRGAAEELRRTIENQTLEATSRGEPCARVLPDLLTRDDLYVQLAQRLPGAPGLLTAFEREVLLRKAAREASAAGAEPPFRVRSGLIVEILALYDELRRRHRAVADFERLLIGALEPSASHDRGAERLLQQTVFLTATFSRFEEAVALTGRIDEHGLRALAMQAAVPIYRQVLVAVADQAADDRGLWTADYDLLARLPHLERLDILATEALLATGLHQRLHDLLPGIQETRADAVAPPPILVVPDAPATEEPARAFVYRDREEELAGVARMIKGGTRSVAVERCAVVFNRPLPYLYLARQVFTDARIPYQTLDSLPLAAEPFAATVDLLFAALSAEFTRSTLIELLRCPHLTFGPTERRVDRKDISALDRFLVDKKYLGRSERLSELLADAESGGAPRYLHALRAASDAATELAAAIGAPRAPDQIRGLIAFLRTREQLPLPTDRHYARHMRARAAVLSALDALAEAHAAHDQDPLSVGELSGAVRRWIESQTFSPRLGSYGLSMMDATAAAFADVDEVRVVGLIDGEWPERGNRGIFYPLSLLTQLGWPSDQDRLSASRARFQDLLCLSRRRISLSTFTLEDDALVAASPLLEDVDAIGLSVERFVAPVAPARVFTHEALALEPLVATAVSGPAAEWLAIRTGRSFDGDRFQGSAGPRAPAAYAVSHVERYLDCPFRYFAAYVLRLPEEREEEAWLTPQERGQFVHEVFCDFFTEWQRHGHGAITAANVADAVELFEQIAEERLARLPEGDRALERTLLLGSAAAPGLAERAFAFEMEHDIPVVERLLEFELRNAFEFEAGGSRRTIEIRSKADRIDLLQDGSLRVIDYKLGRAPNRDRALQLPVYGACATQELNGRHGRTWTISRAGYVAFKEKQAFVSLGRNDADVAKSLADGQARLVQAIDGIEAGQFPPRPDEPFLCNWCAYPSVCRKDYVGDE